MAHTLGPFSPIGDTVSAAITGTSQAIDIPEQTGLAQTVRLANIGNQTVFIKFGKTGVAATAAAGIPLLAGTVEIFDIGSATHIAAIAATTGSTLYATVGVGM